MARWLLAAACLCGLATVAHAQPEPVFPHVDIGNVVSQEFEFTGQEVKTHFSSTEAKVPRCDPFMVPVTKQRECKLAASALGRSIYLEPADVSGQRPLTTFNDNDYPPGCVIKGDGWVDFNTAHPLDLYSTTATYKLGQRVCKAGNPIHGADHGPVFPVEKNTGGQSPQWDATGYDIDPVANNNDLLELDTLTVPRNKISFYDYKADDIYSGWNGHRGLWRMTDGNTRFAWSSKYDCLWHRGKEAWFSADLGKIYHLAAVTLWGQNEYIHCAREIKGYEMFYAGNPENRDNPDWKQFIWSGDMRNQYSCRMHVWWWQLWPRVNPSTYTVSVDYTKKVRTRLIHFKTYANHNYYNVLDEYHGIMEIEFKYYSPGWDGITEVGGISEVDARSVPGGGPQQHYPHNYPEDPHTLPRLEQGHYNDDSDLSTYWPSEFDDMADYHEYHIEESDSYYHSCEHYRRQSESTSDDFRLGIRTRHDSNSRHNVNSFHRCWRKHGRMWTNVYAIIGQGDYSWMADYGKFGTNEMQTNTGYDWYNGLSHWTRHWGVQRSAVAHKQTIRDLCTHSFLQIQHFARCNSWGGYHEWTGMQGGLPSKKDEDPTDGVHQYCRWHEGYGEWSWNYWGKKWCGKKFNSARSYPYHFQGGWSRSFGNWGGRCGIITDLRHTDWRMGSHICHGCPSHWMGDRGILDTRKNMWCNGWGGCETSVWCLPTLPGEITDPVGQSTQAAEYDCAGVMGGNSQVDRCGICGGDGSSCSNDYSKSFCVGYWKPCEKDCQKRNEREWVTVVTGDECPQKDTPVDCPCSTGAATAAQQNVLVQTDQPQKLPYAEQALSPSQESIIKDAGLDPDDLLVRHMVHRMHIENWDEHVRFKYPQEAAVAEKLRPARDKAVAAIRDKKAAKKAMLLQAMLGKKTTRERQLGAIRNSKAQATVLTALQAIDRKVRENRATMDSLL